MSGSLVFGEREMKMKMRRIMEHLFDNREAERLNLVFSTESALDRLLSGLLSGSAIKIFQ